MPGTGLHLFMHVVSFHIKNGPEEDHCPSLEMKWKEAERRRLTSPEVMRL